MFDLNFKDYPVGKPFEPTGLLSFRAKSVPLYTREATEDGRMLMYQLANGMHAVQRVLDTKPWPVIGFVSPRYKIHQNPDIFHQVERVLSQHFAIGNVVRCAVLDEWSFDGRFCVRQYVLRMPSDAVGKSRMLFRIVVFNSFDKSRSFGMYGGSIDALCLNGRVSGAFLKMSVRHNTSIDPTELEEFMTKCIENYGVELAEARHMLGYSVNRVHAEDLLHKLDTTENFRSMIMDEFTKNAYVHGMNLWAVVSTATWWATTRDEGWAVPKHANNDRHVLRNLDRQLIVDRWIAKFISPKIAEKEGKQ